MAEKIHGFLPATAAPPTTNQRLFARYVFGFLVDLVVLDLFAQFSPHVTVDNFALSLLAAALMQALLKATIAIEHHVAAFFSNRPGRLMTALRYFAAWLVLFGSKFVILEALTFAFGDKVRFEGPFNGIVALVAMVITMIVAEEMLVRLYRRLG